MSTDKQTLDHMAERLARVRRLWQSPYQLEESPAEPPRHALAIAISREAGANGSVIGRMLGERLGWPVYDYELVEKIASEMGLRSLLLESVDEKRKSWLRDCVESFCSARAVSDCAYVYRLVETLLSLAMHGECILVGRGANVVAPPEMALRVRLVGSLKDRIATIQKRRSLSQAEAEQWVEETDRERAHFIRYHFHKEADDPHLHDLILNTSRFSLENCVEVIIDVLHRMQTAAHQSAETVTV